MNNWKTLASESVIESTATKLKENNFDVLVVESKQEAKAKFLELVPEGSEVMDMTSITLAETGISQEINESGKFDSVKNKLSKMDRSTHNSQMQKIGSAPDWAVGSVHAITENGQVMIASNSGSQLPGYAYGASRVIWIAGTHKIVKDLDEGFKRVYDHVLPLESERARIAYGVSGSNVSKMLIFHREPKPKRITIILVKEVLGY